MGNASDPQLFDTEAAIARNLALDPSTRCASANAARAASGNATPEVG
jgi:hypothetical protein